MIRAVLNGEAIDSFWRLTQEVRAECDLPGYVTEDPDSVADEMATLEPPVEIVWKNSDRSRDAMGESFQDAVEFLKQIEGEYAPGEFSVLYR